MKNGTKTLLLSLTAIGLAAASLNAADVRQGLVSYWPLDELSADLATTPDVVSGNDFQTDTTFAPADLVPGKRGLAFQFTPDYQTRLWHWNMPGEDTGLPVTEAPEWTMMCWVKATYPVDGETDRRVLSTSSSTDSNPLFNVGTDNRATGGDNHVTLFVRNGSTPINHPHDGQFAAYDGNWHHIAVVAVGGDVQVYVDGQLDATHPYPPGMRPYDITSVGAVVRGPVSGEPPTAIAESIAVLFRGVVDEVAMWERALAPEEIQDVMNNGIQLPVPAFPAEIQVQPVGATGLIVGDAWTFSVSAAGSRPLSFQWKKDGAPIPGATGPTLELTDLTAEDSGTYTVDVSNAGGTVTSDPAVLEVGDWPAPDLERGMLAYWPLDEVNGVKTPDKRSWYDMELVNLTEDDLVPGKWGQCFKFDSSKQTLLQFLSGPEDELPIYPHPSFTISLWVNGDVQQDLRVFSEGSTASSRPLFNIGTHNAAADGTVDTYIRNDNNTSANHQHTQAVAFDNTWHHIVYVQRTVAGQLTAKIYVDGVEDPNPPRPVSPLTVNTTTIGGIRRASPSHWWTGLIDDVAIWERALSPEEIQLLENGTPMPTPRLRPLKINRFQSSLPAVKQGDEVVLSWDVSTDAAVSIDQGIGDVSPLTVSGVGSITVTMNESKTFTLTISRGDESLTAQVHVGTVDGVADNWSLLDNFDQYAPGPLGDTAWWQDLRGGGAIVDVDGNRMLSLVGGDGAAVLPLGPLTLKEGERRTLFCRFRTLDDPALAIRHLLGLTDKNLRWYGDANGNVGPHAIFDNNTADNPGTLLLGTRNMVGGVEEFAPDGLAEATTYNLWIDVDNKAVDVGDTFSIYLQPEGGARVAVFENYTSDRDPAGAVDLGPTQPDLDKLFVAVAQPNNSLLFDDFYISNSGFNATVPRDPGYTGPPTEVTLDITLSDGQVTISWENGTLLSAPTVNGPWTPVDGAAPPNYQVAPDEQAAFYKVEL